ncbi:GAF domain-containing protein [Pseudarthrobacter sp. PvP090]|uniref:GAF domain-containing protein n=1 Tax=Pseudarthrobacter sp. PvP090 TaxID=3156393 RepID=UPI00339B0EC2
MSDIERLNLQVVEQAVKEEVGFKLFTILAFRDQGREMERIYSSHPREYPVGGRKDVSRDVAADWLDACLVSQRPFFGPTQADVERIFKDADTITSLGCGSIINAPILRGGTTVAALNVLDAEGAYVEQDVDKVMEIARLYSTIILEATGE